MQIDWNKYLRYEDGKLYWKVREGKDQGTKMWNTRYSGTEAGYIRDDGYRSLRINKKGYFSHRIIWEMFNGKIPEGMEIDHIDFNPDNNKISNLQALTRKRHNDRKGQQSRGYRVNRTAVTKPYQACRTDKYFGTPCGAYMSFMTAFVQGG